MAKTEPVPDPIRMPSPLLAAFLALGSAIQVPPRQVGNRQPSA